MSPRQQAWDAYQQAEADVRRAQAAVLTAQRRAQLAFERYQRADRAELDHLHATYFALPEEPTCS